MNKWKLIHLAPLNKPILVYRADGTQQVETLTQEEGDIVKNKTSRALLWMELPASPNVDCSCFSDKIRSGKMLTTNLKAMSSTISKLHGIDCFHT
ncbi:hypothetical protein [Oligella sp. HMSC09E12]|uniref:hypothetical protein n=1 Tax=Oligella sp. HMSC09E12 TaxID=1581147 RepID=UPI00114CDF95|nr:hypothetical protein [Oligella sp. HMSC09E12]